ncbi:hypothetical protein QFZ28_004018 [Neobacillus niacini]|uniref:hypothetical protein n=1 Tax=Neobacillus niacini TaxID=86668 RepID=UPI002782FD4B|nr:hypothetical protein [Neobacillus niacini]MDQ1003618.1 hypothetical protein [Neobacillus niacini]
MVVGLPDKVEGRRKMPNQDKRPRKKITHTLDVITKKSIYGGNHEEIDISSEDFFEKYDLVIDGEKLTEADLKIIIEHIRKLRE